MKDINDNLTDEYNNITFRFGITENGEYGYIVTGEDGADTVIPFKNEDQYKEIIVDALENAKLGLTYESTWEEIAYGLNTLFPDQLNVLTYFGVTQFYYCIGAKSSNVGKTGTWDSEVFDITYFNTMETIVSTGTTSGKGSASVSIIFANGTKISLSGTQTKDISTYTGEAYIHITSSCSSGGSVDAGTYYTSAGWGKVTKLLLKV